MTVLPVDGTLFQEAYLVDDLERAADAWSSTLGAGPFVIAPHHRCDRFDHHRSHTPGAPAVIARN